MQRLYNVFIVRLPTKGELTQIWYYIKGQQVLFALFPKSIEQSTTVFRVFV